MSRTTHLDTNLFILSRSAQLKLTGGDRHLSFVTCTALPYGTPLAWSLSEVEVWSLSEVEVWSLSEVEVWSLSEVEVWSLSEVVGAA